MRRRPREPCIIKTLAIMRKILLTLLVTFLSFQTFMLVRPLPAVEPVNALPTMAAAPKVELPWPAYGQSAIGATGMGLLESHGSTTPAPIASVTKIITAMAILKAKPLAPGQQGPTITLDAQDVASFEYYYVNNGSVTQVSAGGKMSQYQALQALLIPSSNNMADSLVRWAFGSNENYITYAKAMVKELGMSHTTVGSASGFSNETKSTARDLVIIGQAALANPVIADIVSKKESDIPVAGTIRSTNWLLGAEGITGVKTGNTDAAGGCYLFASSRVVHGKKVTLVGAVMGAPSIATAMVDSRALAKASDSAFSLVTPIRVGQTIGTYKLPWGHTAPAVAKQDISLLAWQGHTPAVSSTLQPLKVPAGQDKAVGSVTVVVSGQKTGSPVVVKEETPGPSLRWRLWP
jgi:serine-type D-Ala-D-Ala carboxypeptidase (penicillin-binding protein 5/6)